MKCIWCLSPNEAEKAKSTSDVLLSAVFDRYICSGGHKSIICMKCGRNSLSTKSAISHYIWCSVDGDGFNFDQEILIGEIGIKNIYLNVEFILPIIPHIFMLRIDYKAVLKEFIVNHANMFPSINHSLHDKDLIEEVINIIKKSNAQCSICEQYYEDFPCETITITHCELLHS